MLHTTATNHSEATKERADTTTVEVLVLQALALVVLSSLKLLW